MLDGFLDAKPGLFGKIHVSTVSTILASYIAYRKKRPDLHAKSLYKMPGGVPMAWFSLGFLAFVLGLLALRPDTRLALCVMPAWFIWLGVAYQFSRFKGGHWIKAPHSVTSDPHQ